MELKPLGEAYKGLFQELVARSKAAAEIDASNVYQPANLETRKYATKICSDNTAPGSHLENKENFIDFVRQVNAGKRGLILMEHYSNTDLPSFIYQLETDEAPECRELAEKIVAIAGMKLNEDNPYVRAVTESYSRVVIYPSRSKVKKMASAEDEEAAKAEEARAKKINLAAMRAMDECKKRGQVILVFPSGTRYRPGYPETKHGLREIDSYLRLFDVVLLVSINGMILRLRDEDMLNDLIGPAEVVFTAHKVLDCKSFRNEYLSTLPADEEDPKQKMIDHVMEILEDQHNSTESKLNG